MYEKVFKKKKEKRLITVPVSHFFWITQSLFPPYNHSDNDELEDSNLSSNEK